MQRSAAILAVVLLYVATACQIGHYRFHQAHAVAVLETGDVAKTVSCAALPVLFVEDDTEPGQPYPAGGNSAFTAVVASPSPLGDDSRLSSAATPELRAALQVVYLLVDCPLCELAHLPALLVAASECDIRLVLGSVSHTPLATIRLAEGLASHARARAPPPLSHA